MGFSVPDSRKGIPREIRLRMTQMKKCAKKAGKYVPTDEEIKNLPGFDLVCPDCGKEMLVTSRNNPKKRNRVMSLQHYRDGTLALVCISCNSRHGKMKGDSYRDLYREKNVKRYRQQKQYITSRRAKEYARWLSWQNVDASHKGGLEVNQH